VRRAARVDANQDQVIVAFRAAGAYVWIIGLPVDLLVGYKGHTMLVEIKDGPNKRLTALQQAFFAKWAGGTLVKVDGPEAALNVLKVINAKP